MQMNTSRKKQKQNINKNVERKIMLKEKKNSSKDNLKKCREKKSGKKKREIGSRASISETANERIHKDKYSK